MPSIILLQTNLISLQFIGGAHAHVYHYTSRHWNRPNGYNFIYLITIPKFYRHNLSEFLVFRT